jgi:hypothetical protein
VSRTSRLLPPLDMAKLHDALGPMLSAELASFTSEVARAKRQAEALERRLFQVLDRVAARLVELHEPIESLQAQVRAHAEKRRPVKLVRP